MRSVFVLLLTLFIGAAPLTAKENKDLMKGNYYYSHFDFHQAIPYYQRIADEMNDPLTYARLADCFRLTGNLQSAADWYAKAAKTPGCQDAALLHYGQVLMQLMQYDEAEKWLKKYQKNNKTDIRALNLIKGCETAMVKVAQGIPSGSATLLDLNTDGDEFAPTLWKGNLVFTSDTDVSLKKKTDEWTGNSYCNIYSVPCDINLTCGSHFTTVTADKDLNIRYHDGPCTFSTDGSQMYFTRSKSKNNLFGQKSVANTDSVVLLEIMIASDYDPAKGQFRKTTPFAYNSNDYSVAHPTVSPNGNMLVFSSNMLGGRGVSDLYICMRTSGSYWSKPENLGRTVNTEGEELFPYWADDNTLYFSSDGHEGFGGLDIYVTKWNARTRSFSAPENVGMPINSSYDDMSLALFADGRSSFFSSNRPATKGGDNIYFYKRRRVHLLLKPIDSLTFAPISEVNFHLDATPSAPVMHDTLSARGPLLSQLFPWAEYRIRISKDGYTTKNFTINANDIQDGDTIVRNIIMYRPPQPGDNPPKPVSPVRFTEIKGTPEIDKVYEIGQVPFNYDKYNILPSARPCLDSLADFLNANKNIRIEVRAHTDCREKKPGYNITLSDRRARSVVEYLQKKGITSSRLTANGLGSSEPRVKCPICEQCTEAQHYQNRIMDFKVLKAN